MRRLARRARRLARRMRRRAGGMRRAGAPRSATLPALLRRFPTLAPAEAFEDVAFRSFHFIYGMKSLEVNW